MRELVVLPAWEAMSRVWKIEILAEIKPIWRDVEGQERQFCGVLMDPRKFLPMYMERFLRRRELDGNLPVAGNYEVEFKVTDENDILPLNFKKRIITINVSLEY